MCIRYRDIEKISIEHTSVGLAPITSSCLGRDRVCVVTCTALVTPDLSTEVGELLDVRKFKSVVWEHLSVSVRV